MVAIRMPAFIWHRSGTQMVGHPVRLHDRRRQRLPGETSQRLPGSSELISGGVLIPAHRIPATLRANASAASIWGLISLMSRGRDTP